MNNHQKGQCYEEKTAQYLTSNHCKILEMNYRKKTGEIDIIARSKEMILFVEVKYRSNTSFGYPSHAVDYYKQKRIKNTAIWYLKEHNLFEKPIRFDVALWCDGKLDYYKGAFTYD